MTVAPIIKRQILMACFSYSKTEWSRYLRRWEDVRALRRGRTIDFEGSPEEFDALTDMLYKDESNSKVMGIYYEGGKLTED